jgi:olfactory receptor
LTGNMLISLAIWTSTRLHTPMYFFLANLSLLEIGYPCSVISKMLQSLVGEARGIFREGYATWMFFYLCSLVSVKAVFWQPWFLTSA